MTLADAQRAMRDALHLGRPDALLRLTVPAGERAPEAAVAAYENMYVARLVDALAPDFPEVAARIGPELFARVVLTHVRARPSKHPSLAFLGRGFDQTLDDLGLVAEAAIAKLELARVEAFWAPDAVALDAVQLGALGENLGGAVLRFHPSLHVVEGETPLAVWRRDHDVHETPIPALEARALSAARAGACVADVFELFLAEPDPERAALGTLLAWVSRGWIVGARVQDALTNG